MPHVLLVEPDAALADEIRSAFGPAGFDVTTLSAGEEAVQRCREVVPDLILLSAELPDMSGFSVCNRLRRALAGVPLILLTREATDAAVEAHRATRTRADDYLRKPVDLADLLGRAATLLQDAPPPPAPDARPTAPRATATPPARPAAPPLAPPLTAPTQASERPATADDATPPVLRRAASSAVAKLGLAAAMAAAPPPTSAAPPRPPPTPAGKGPPATLARVKIAAPPRPEIPDPFADPPRDPSPPKGTPEEKLEFFRDRLRARDAFIARAREVWGTQKAEAVHLRGESEVLRSELDAARERTSDLERRLGEASQDGAARDARIADIEAQLAQSEETRQSLSDVLSETMQAQERAETDWSARVAAAEEARARVEMSLADEGETHARVIAALEGDRADERARFEAARAEAEERHAAAVAAAEAERQTERADSEEKLADAGRRAGALEGERDRVRTAMKELEARLAHQTEAAAEARRAADADAAALRARIDEAQGRAQAVAGELADAVARVEVLEGEGARAAEARRALERELEQARGERSAYAEKASATEQAFHAKATELQAAQSRLAELTAAIDATRASAEGAKGEVARTEGARAEAERRAAKAGAERDALARDLETALRDAAATRERTGRLEVEIIRLKKLEPVAEEAARLRRDVAALREQVQQRAVAADAAARAAQAAQAERAEVEERLATESGKRSGEASRIESELANAHRRVADLENERSVRDAELRKVKAEAEERRKALADGAADLEKRHTVEVARLKSAMIDLERHLEARARAELALKKKVAELEKSSAKPLAAPTDPAALAALKAALAKVRDDAEELRGENEFLNGEVARYQQKNRELATAIASLKEV
jgi:CheY-like chemotaxis protein